MRLLAAPGQHGQSQCAVAHTRRSGAQVKAVTKVVFYKKLNPNHRKYIEGLSSTSKRRNLLQTPVPPQNGTTRSADPVDVQFVTSQGSVRWCMLQTRCSLTQVYSEGVEHCGLS